MKALGTSSAVISSGFLAWQLFGSDKHSRHLTAAPVPLLQDVVVGDGPQYLHLPGSIVADMTSDYDDTSLSPAETREELRSLIPRHLRRPWRLLHQANTGDYEQHLTAVKELARLSLSEGEIVQLAQACQRRTAVGLARCEGTDLRWFLKVPLPQAVISGDILELLRDVLETLRLGSGGETVHQCIRTLTDSALEDVTYSYDQTLDTDISSSFHRESHHLRSIPGPSLTTETIVENCLQALLSHSTVEEQCHVITQHTLALPLLYRLAETFPHNSKLSSLIGQILANICQHDQLLEAVWRAGWVRSLAAWRTSRLVEVSLPAEKCLANMDAEFGGSRYSPGVYLLAPSDRLVSHTNSLSNWGVDGVFVHGLWGGVFFTWREREREGQQENFSPCWPRDWLLTESHTRDHVRLLGCDFHSYLSQWGNDCPVQNFKRNLDERSEDMLAGLVRAGVGRRPVIFVGHSMGGLIIKKMLLLAQSSHDKNIQSLAENTKGVVFYSTPHHGSHIAKINPVLKYIVFPSVEVQELEINHPALIDLNSYFKTFVSRFKTRVISFGETQTTRHLGVDLQFVPVDSSDPGVGEFHAVPYNHIDICKPESVKSILFRKLSNLLWDCLDEASPFLQ